METVDIYIPEAGKHTSNSHRTINRVHRLSQLRVTCGSVVQRPLASGPPQARLLTAQDVAISESMKFAVSLQ